VELLLSEAQWIGPIAWKLKIHFHAYSFLINAYMGGQNENLGGLRKIRCG
jgi:hypothetical protein